MLRLAVLVCALALMASGVSALPEDAAVPLARIPSNVAIFPLSELKPGMKGGAPVGLRFCFEPRPHRRIGGWKRRQSFHQSTEIKTCSTDQDRCFSPRSNLIN